MNEAFLHYIWEFQYFDKTDLTTTTGEKVLIFHPGTKNRDAGPDFFNGKIKIDNVAWSGNIEIHVQSSEWIDHKHHHDNAYENVVLHVVWSENQAILRRDQSRLPTIELKGRVKDEVILNYQKLIQQPATIPCGSFLPEVDSIKKISMIERALVERLEHRADKIFFDLRKNSNDWDQTSYQLLCRNFGFKVNSNIFERLAAVLPFKLIRKHVDQLLQVEALLFGQAGFLEEQKSASYFALLKREHGILSKKYNISDAKLNKAQWKFLRLRPANFPTIRIAQLATLLTERKNLFSEMVHATSYKELFDMFSVTQSDYWKVHYNFDTPAKENISGLGQQSADNIIINTVVPLLVAYGKMKDDQHVVDRAMEILQGIPAEDNVILRHWKNLEIVAGSSAESQGLIELYNNYCLRRRCLDCSIGFSLLDPGK